MKRRFEWDERKAVGNLRKHGVTFWEAVTIFHDPCILSRYDDEHSDTEDRWVVLGESERSRLLVVIQNRTKTQRSSGSSRPERRPVGNLTSII